MRKLSSYMPSLIVLGTAILVLLAGPSAVWQLTYAQTKARIIRASEGLTDNPILDQLNQAYRDIATLVEPSVVHISTEHTVRDRFDDERILSSSGSGWIYDDTGHIVTNYHVIEDAERIEVQLSTGELREAEVVGYDQSTDIALIRIHPGRLFPAVRASSREHDDLEPVRQGDLVFAFGSPFDFRFSMSSGVVSGIGRSVGVMGYENFIQVDAAINPGNSGGPLTDARGRVIGMNTAIATGREINAVEEGQFAGIGLAIPIAMIDPVVQQLIMSGVVQKGFLGVSVVDRQHTVAYEIKAVLGFRGYGLATARIDVGNPARDAGLRIRDVITHANGQRVATLSQLETAVSGVGPDDTVELTVWRFDRNTQAGGTLTIELPGVVAASGFRGLWLLQFDDQIGSWLNLLGYSGRGVRTARIDASGPAGRAGLRDGDVITHVNDTPTESVAQLRSMISSMLPGQIAHLQLWRFEPQLGQGRTLSIDVPLDRLDWARTTGFIPPDQELDGIESLGIGRMATCTPQLAEEYRVRFAPGVLIQEIIPGSELDGKAEPGSIIVAVMDHTVADREDFFDVLSNFDLRQRSGVRLTFLHPDGRHDQAILHVR